MAIRTPWQTKYGIAGQLVGTNTTFAFGTDAAKVGLTADNVFGLPLTEHAELSPGPEFASTQKTTGLVTPRVGVGYERTKFINRPTTSLVLGEADAYLSSFFAWLLCQKAGSESTTVQTYKPLTMEAADSGCEFWCSITRAMSTSGSDWQAIHGAIASSLTWSAEEVGALSLSAEIMGAQWEQSMAPGANAYATFLAAHTKASLLWQDAVVKLTDGNGTGTIQCPSWSFTLENNAVAKYYNKPSSGTTGRVQKFVLGQLLGTGNFIVPWDQATVGDDEQIEAFITENLDVLLEVYWGTQIGTSAGDLSFKLNCRYTGAPLENGDEISTALEYEIVADGTNEAFEIVANNNYTMAIPA